MCTALGQTCVKVHLSPYLRTFGHPVAWIVIALTIKSRKLSSSNVVGYQSRVCNVDKLEQRLMEIGIECSRPLPTVLLMSGVIGIRLVCFYQRVSIASYASAGIARAEMSVRPSVRHTPVLYQNEES